jgi:uncharacterized membrane protein
LFKIQVNERSKSMSTWSLVLIGVAVVILVIAFIMKKQKGS